MVPSLHFELDPQKMSYFHHSRHRIWMETQTKVKRPIYIIISQVDSTEYNNHQDDPHLKPPAGMQAAYLL